MIGRSCTADEKKNQCFERLGFVLENKTTQERE